MTSDKGKKTEEKHGLKRFVQGRSMGWWPIYRKLLE